jgi:hypothetical protein
VPATAAVFLLLATAALAQQPPGKRGGLIRR